MGRWGLFMRAGTVSNVCNLEKLLFFLTATTPVLTGLVLIWGSCFTDILLSVVNLWLLTDPTNSVMAKVINMTMQQEMVTKYSLNILTGGGGKQRNHRLA